MTVLNKWWKPLPSSQGLKGLHRSVSHHNSVLNNLAHLVGAVEEDFKI